MSVHHSFDIQLAQEFGSVEMSILFHHFEYWISYNSRMKINEYEGKFWTYQTLKEICEHFPYWSCKQVERLINKMVLIGILQKGNFNKISFDRTVWYTFTEKWYDRIGKCISRNREMEIPKSGNQISRNRDTYTKYYNNTKTHTFSNENVAQSRASHGRELPPEFFFSPTTGKFEHIKESDLSDWKKAYPQVDIAREIAKAEQWLLSNPTKSKKKLWRKFLTGWFERVNDRNENKTAYRQQNDETTRKNSKLRAWESKQADSWKPVYTNTQGE